MRWTFSWAGCGLLALTALTTGSGLLRADDLAVGPVYLDDFPRVQVVVEPPVVGDSGPPAIALSDLTLLEDGEPTGSAESIQSFGEIGHGVAVVIAVDVSGTMAGKPLAETVRAMDAMLDEAAPRDRFAVISFADDVRLESSFDNTRDELRQALEGLTPRGRITELYLALFKAFEQFESSSADLPVRRRLLVISDGKDEGEAYQLDDVIERSRERGIPVDAVGLTRIDERYLSNLNRLAELSGGSYFRADDASDLEAIVRQGQEQLAATPVATFSVTELTPDDLPHSLGVRWLQDGRVLEGTTRVVLPRLPEPEGIEGRDAGTVRRDAPGPPWWRDLRWIALACGLAGILLGLLLWRWLRTSRRRDEPSPPVPAPGSRSGIAPRTEDSEYSVAPRLSVPLVEGHARPAADSPSSEASVDVPLPESPPSSRRRTQFRSVFPEPGGGRPSAALIAEDGPADGSSFAIESSPFWIGAAEDADLCLSSDKFLSSHHASIQYYEGSLLLYDNHSTNGTFVNEIRVGETPRPLAPGDRIRFGRSTFRLGSA